VKRFVELIIRQRVVINVIFIILLIAGLYSFKASPIQNMPPVDIGKVFIYTMYYGASPEDVESLVTDKIEDALDGLENVEYIQSNSMRNVSTVEIKFIDDTDYRHQYDEMRLRILNIKNDLPEEVDEPSFIYIDTEEFLPVIVVNVASNDTSNKTLNMLAEELKTELKRVNGVESVELRGDYAEEFNVALSPDKLREYGISFYEAAKAVESANLKIPAGIFRKNGTEYMLDTGRKFSSQKEILNAVVRKDGDGSFVRVKDLTVYAGEHYRDPDVLLSVNGESTVQLVVKKIRQGDASDIASEVKEISSRFGRIHGKEGINIHFTQDSTLEINDSINVLGGNMLMGIILVVIILWVTLGFKNAILTSIGIPFAILFAIMLNKMFGYSINTITIFSFVLISGIIVDDSVIIVENIYRHLQSGKKIKDAVRDGTAEVFLPVTSSATTTILAFVPMFIMTGSTGDFFAFVPLTVIFALVASIIEALVILPIHYLEWGPKKKVSESDIDEHAHISGGVFGFFWNIYKKIVTVFLNRPIKTLLVMTVVFWVAIGILFLSATGIVPLIKVKFFPESYYRYHVTFELPTGSSVQTMDRIVKDVSKYIMAKGKGEADSISGIAGFYEDVDYQRHRGHYYGSLVVTLPNVKDHDFPVEDNNVVLYLEHIRKDINSYADNMAEKWGMRPEITLFGENTGPPVGKDVNIRVTANDLDSARAVSDKVIEFLNENEETKALYELGDNRAKPQTALKIRAVDEKVKEYGLDPSFVTAFASGALSGVFSGEYRAANEEIDLKVKIARASDSYNVEKEGIAVPEDILMLPVVEDVSGPIYLKDVISMDYGKEPNVIRRYNGKPAITITANIEKGSQLSSSRVQNLVKKRFENIASDYPGVVISFGGEFEETQRAFSSLAAAFLIALLGIYMVLAAQFNDYFQPAIILSAIAFAVIGVVYGMFFTRSVFTIQSFIAVVGLAGVAVNDSLILIDFMNVRRREGMELREAVISACSSRMRPVLITTVTTMLGLLPMAIGFPNKSTEWSSMATAFTSGLASATILTLLIIPAEYELLERIRMRVKKRKIIR
jgi:HAE1 family hydrophobic/amphiphilic exporter-1